MVRALVFSARLEILRQNEEAIRKAVTSSAPASASALLFSVPPTQIFEQLLCGFPSAQRCVKRPLAIYPLQLQWLDAVQC